MDGVYTRQRRQEGLREGNGSGLLICAGLLDLIDGGIWVLAPCILQSGDLGQAQMPGAQNFLQAPLCACVKSSREEIGANQN